MGRDDLESGWERRVLSGNPWKHTALLMLRDAYDTQSSLHWESAQVHLGILVHQDKVARR